MGYRIRSTRCWSTARATCRAWGIVFVAFLFSWAAPSLQAEESRSDRERLLIAYSGSNPHVDFWAKLRAAAYAKASDLGAVVVDYSAEDFSLERQSGNIRQAVGDGVSGMILGAVADEVASAVSELEAAGVPVVAVGVPIDHPWVSVTITIDNSRAAGLAASYLTERLAERAARSAAAGEPARVVVLTGDRAQVDARLRADAVAAPLRAAGYEVGVHYADSWSGAHSLKALLGEFSEHGARVAAVFAAFAPASIAMVEAAESRGMSPLMVGFDMNEIMREMIRNGRLHATVVQDPAFMGRVGIEKLVEVIEGHSVPDFIEAPAILVNRENVDAF